MPKLIPDIIKNEHINQKSSSEEYSEYIKIRNAYLSREKAKDKKFFTIAFTLILALIPAFFGAFIAATNISSAPSRYIDKKSLQEQITSIISNNGDLRSIKHALATQPLIGDLKLIFTSKQGYYPDNIALSSVLDDLRVIAYTSGNTELLPKLDPIISEYEETNPFDNLQPSQKDYFESIRSKSGETYNKISNEVNNLAEELHQKNLLTNEYLADSKTSYWISIIALLISLLIGGYQIYAARPSATKKIFLEALDSEKQSIESQPESSSQRPL